ncbi:tetratricopeptide repeat protein, partial [Methanothrix sp.]|uniref:tetratricopeptide repeat protein n=1 Tax=Methanothrix sp. TaxID=90426 RepID=UPI003BB71938
MNIQNGVGKRQTNLRSCAIVGFSLLALAALCTCALAQENTSGYWIERAEELSQNSSFEEAAIAYEKALQIEPENATIWHSLGFELMTIGKENESIRALEKALSLFNESLAKNPQDADAWNQKGLVLMSLGRPDECRQARLKALDLFNQTIERDPKNARAWLSKAEILAYMGQNDEALKAYDMVIDLEPEEYGVMNRKAE